MSNAKGRKPTSVTVPTGKAEILKQLAAVETENAVLKRRLAESESTLAALVSEQVDAVIESATSTPLLLQQTQKALLASEAALQKAKQELEKRVLERTGELEKTQRQIADILNSIKDGLYALDKEWRFLYINQRTAENAGYKPEELVGKKILEMYPQLCGSLFEEKCREVMEHRQATHFEMAGVVRSIYYAISIYPTNDGVSVYSVDVTERKRAELALQEERDRAQSYLNIAGTMIVVLDADQKVALINASGCQILGRPEDEILGANWFDTFIPERLRMEYRAGFAKMLATDGDSGDYFERVVLTGDGEERLIAWHDVPLRDAAGKITGALRSGEDITERRRIERDLQQAYDLLETVTQGTEVIIAVVDTGYRYLYFNKAYAEEVERLSGKPLTMGASILEQFAHLPEQQQLVLESWGPTLRGEKSERIIEFGDPGRYRRIYRTLKTPLWDATGQVIGAGEVASDVTKQVQAEEALRLSEKRYHALFNGMTEGFAVHRIIRDEQGTPVDYHFLDINPAFERLTGLRREDVVGKDKSQIPQLQNDDPIWVERYGKVALTGEPVHFENYSPPLDRYYDVFAFCPEPGQFAVLFMDVTQRRQAEQRIESLARFPDENPNPIMRIDREGKLLYANKASRPLMEVWNCAVGQSLAQPWRGLARQALAMEEEKTADVQCGDQIYSVRFVPILGAGYVNLYGRDVTEQVRATQALLEARDELELRVQQRTQALEITNEQLLTEIVERTKAEEALHSAYSYNRSLIDASLDPLVTITPEGKIGDVNLAAEAVTGYSRDELIGTDFHNYFTDPDKARSGYQQVFEQGTVRDYELEIRRKDGYVTSVVYNASIYRHESGEIAGVFAAARDITQRKQAEHELQQQEALLRTVLENLPVGVWVTDAHGNIIQGNPAGQSIWAGARYVGVEQYGEYKAWWVSSGKLITVDDWAAARAVRKGETSINEEIEIECFDGTHKIILNSAIPLRDAQQAIVGSIIVNQDITEIKRAQEELEESKELLEKVFASVDLMIAYMDKDFNFLRVNRAYAVADQREPDFYIGKNHFDLFPYEENETIFKEVVRSGEPYIVFERPFEYSDHTERGVSYWDWSLLPVKDTSGNVQGLVLSLSDVTRRKTAEMELDADRQRLLMLSQSERAQRLFAESLARTMLVLNSSLDLNEVLDHILEQIQSVIPFRSANIALLEDQVVHVVRQRGSEKAAEGYDIVQDRFSREAFPFWEKLAGTRQGLVIGDLTAEPEAFSLPGLEWARAYLGAALLSGTNAVGFINLFSDQPEFFSPEAADRLTAFASQAALAIQNARLYRDLENSLDQEQSMRSQLVQAEKFAAMGRMLGSVAHELNNPLQTIQNCLYLTQQDTPAGSPDPGIPGNGLLGNWALIQDGGSAARAIPAAFGDGHPVQ